MSVCGLELDIVVGHDAETEAEYPVSLFGSTRGGHVPEVDGTRLNFRPLSATENLTPWTVMTLLLVRDGCWTLDDVTLLSLVAETRYVLPDIFFSRLCPDPWNRTLGSVLVTFCLLSSLNLDLNLEMDFLPELFLILPEFELPLVLDFLNDRGVMKLNLYLAALEGVFFTFLMIFVLVLTS